MLQGTSRSPDFVKQASHITALRKLTPHENRINVFRTRPRGGLATPPGRELARGGRAWKLGGGEPGRLKASARKPGKRESLWAGGEANSPAPAAMRADTAFMAMGGCPVFLARPVNGYKAGYGRATPPGIPAACPEATNPEAATPKDTGPKSEQGFSLSRERRARANCVPQA
jgi:hypothetical protein